MWNECIKQAWIDIKTIPEKEPIKEKRKYERKKKPAPLDTQINLNTINKPMTE